MFTCIVKSGIGLKLTWLPSPGVLFTVGS